MIELKGNEHITNEQIINDIADTESEILLLERQVKGHELIGDKMAMFMASGKRNKIQERQEFIKELKTLLKLREEKENG